MLQLDTKRGFHRQRRRLRRCLALLLSTRRRTGISTPATAPSVSASNREYRAYHIDMRNDAIDGMPARPFGVSFYRGRNYFTGECAPSIKIDRNRRHEDVDSCANARFLLELVIARVFNHLSNFRELDLRIKKKEKRKKNQGFEFQYVNSWNVFQRLSLSKGTSDDVMTTLNLMNPVMRNSQEASVFSIAVSCPSLNRPAINARNLRAEAASPRRATRRALEMIYTRSVFVRDASFTTRSPAKIN